MGSIMTIFLQPFRGQMDVFDVGTPAVREGWALNRVTSPRPLRLPRPVRCGDSRRLEGADGRCNVQRRAMPGSARGRNKMCGLHVNFHPTKKDVDTSIYIPV